MPTLIHAKVRSGRSKFNYKNLNSLHYKHTDTYIYLCGRVNKVLFIKCTLSDRVVEWMTDVIITERCNRINHIAVNNYTLLQNSNLKV